VLLLVSYRPEYQHAWGSKTSYGQMRLDALQAESAGELLEALLGEDPGLASLKQLLVKRGNPFFLEETVRTLVETKALVGERGRYRLTQPVQAIQVPATVQAMLAARIDRLPQEDKRLLQVASVIGKDVPFALLQAIAELPDEALRRGLDHLQAAEFLHETGSFPDLEYTFKHALTHDVTYSGLLQERRRAFHARIVEAIETLHGDRLGGEIERLAHHALRGELQEKAVSYLRQAGRKASARSALQDARIWFEHALSVHGRDDDVPRDGHALLAGAGGGGVEGARRVTCPQCAFENPPAMAFCGGCGTRLTSLCPSCGFANPEGFAFCGKCGARVAEVRVTSPRSYTQSTSPRRSSTRGPPSRASASRSRSSSPISRAPWSYWPTVIPKRRARSSIPCSSE
jgi:hypothetical protein